MSQSDIGANPDRLRGLVDLDCREAFYPERASRGPATAADFG